MNRVGGLFAASPSPSPDHLDAGSPPFLFLLFFGLFLGLVFLSLSPGRSNCFCRFGAPPPIPIPPSRAAGAGAARRGSKYRFKSASPKISISSSSSNVTIGGGGTPQALVVLFASIASTAS